MIFFIFLVSLLLLLLAVTLVTTMIKLSLLVTTKYKYETYILIVPAILHIILWSGLIVLWFIISDRYTDGGILNIFMDYVFDISFDVSKFNFALICAIICCFVGILLQSFVFLTVNIPYKNIRVKLNRIFFNIKKWFVEKILKKDLKPISMPISEIVIPEKWTPLKYINSLISSIFSFAVVFIIIIILVISSNFISNKVLNKIIDKNKTVQTTNTDKNITEDAQNILNKANN